LIASRKERKKWRARSSTSRTGDRRAEPKEKKGLVCSGKGREEAEFTSRFLLVPRLGNLRTDRLFEKKGEKKGKGAKSSRLPVRSRRGKKRDVSSPLCPLPDLQKEEDDGTEVPLEAKGIKKEKEEGDGAEN